MAGTSALSPYFKQEIAPGAEFTSDEELLTYIKQNCETVYHPSGTCAMGDKNDAATVVTPDLKVKGLEGLRIADASVFPDMVTVNICNTVMMISEQAVDIICADRVNRQ
ncbi:MAG: choline dehydrogenase-like flavoprotein [Gammaproteobacteria bacterium]